MKPSDGYPVKPSPSLKKWMTVALLLILLWLCATETEASLAELIGGIPEMGKFIAKMFPPDWEYLRVVVKPMIETVQMAILGTTFGAIFALPISFLAASNVTKGWIVRTPARFILNLSRTIPDLLFAALFATVFGYGPLAGMLALSFFSFGILSKWAYEAIETIDNGPMEAMTAVGANKLQWIFFGVIPQVLAQFIGFAMYMFEINIRAAAILGIVGAGGIGIYLNRTLGMFRYDQTIVIILFTLVLVLAIDAISSRIRGKLI
ncbi:phosphonate ABC transporter, permease protein PhnE [Cohnella cholangitidis]|uniref:Phosphonate ABC transporter, permease protein PhnE n=1 Tax=Cohnella cholangitidis TaxID=2598458 RepID=A0A7G5BW25_9BACL|nr:phosphonate ABC transporter, permease protein PhnE [Cohnella cholangitidis]QMV41159.1 phosphonate ABC transporter, permease protein PhnE [Cohnella cholangitidis]